MNDNDNTFSGGKPPTPIPPTNPAVPGQVFREPQLFSEAGKERTDLIGEYPCIDPNPDHKGATR